jgi:glycosyltransferase involved in cell wall biosynthesis
MALPLEDTIVNRGRWPHKLGDMISCERPVVTSAGGEFPQILGERGCASLAAFEPAAFAAALLRILETPEEGQRMAERGRNFAQTELEWSIIGRQVLDVIERVA